MAKKTAAMRNHLKDIILALADAGVDFVVAGGVAAVLHGVERVTLDLDLAVDLDAANLERFIGVMRSMGLTPRAPVAPEVILNPADRRAMIEEKHAVVFSFLDRLDPLRYVDIFLREDFGYPVLMADGVTVEIEGRIIRVASKQRLIEMKRRVQPTRDKDALDILALTKLLENEG